MRITIETIPHEEHRPEAGPTIGDWQFDNDGSLAIRVSQLGDRDYEFLIGLHEMIEAWACYRHGIRQEEVDAFDQKPSVLAEQGDDPAAPYHNEHVFAGVVERLMAHELSVEWAQYERAIEACGC